MSKETVQSHEHNSQEARRAMIFARIDEREAQRIEAQRIVDECDEAIESLRKQLLETYVEDK